MKSIILTIFLLVQAILLSSQTNLDHYNYEAYGGELRYEDQYYQRNFQGIKQLMIDLKANNSDLHSSLSPQFQQLQDRRNQSNIILGAGVGCMTILGLVAKRTTLSNLDGISRNGSSKLIPLLGLSAIIGTTSIILYSKKSIKYQDILNFTNEFNRQSEGNKIELSIIPKVNIETNLTAGLSLNFTF